MPSRRGRLVLSLLALAPAVAFGAAACPSGEPALFEVLAPSRTGVTFVNRLVEDTSFNSLNYLYYYNGGGVAVGDINNDGLPDLYFTSNTGANRLYLNKGNYRFEDITERAGVADSVGWKTGTTMADVNGDGFVDIFVCGLSYRGMRGRNVLYINNGDGTFTERTAEYGLDFEGYATQALFFDYDGDGHLDMYLLNHSVHDEHGAGTAASRFERNPRAGDRLYRNDRGRFVDVSAAAGIYGSAFGYGLGVVATDLDGDGCLDLYVANDFQEDDYLYRNNCDGTFTEIGAAAWQHTSRSSMGVDAADFNNDGRPDIIVADMLPDREAVLKTSATVENLALAQRRIEAGYHPQFAHNTLQLNRGVIAQSGRSGLAPRFSEMAFLAGVAATDWSWAPLFADLDNDGRKDLFITSGIFRRPNDLDYLALAASAGVQASLRAGITRQNLSLTAKMPSVPVPNRAFRNNGDLTFTDATDAWGLSQVGFSNGAVYVDLNNSGALDLVVNRVNASAAIYRNRAREINGAHYLGITLVGDGANTAGIGARVTVWSGGSMQMLEQMPTRGFESSVDPRLHFGLGAATRVDSLRITWPDRRVQVLANVDVDRTLTIRQAEAVRRDAPRPIAAPVFADVTAAVGLAWKHREPESLDFVREPLLPHRLSAQGPAIAVADVDGDGLEDLYVGGGRGQPAVLFLQQRDGTFRASDQPGFRADSLYDSADAVFFDANGDGRPDLYVVSGTETVPGYPDLLEDRLYINNGTGGFRRDTTALPPMEGGGSRVVAADFNGDGRIDLFVGRRSAPGASYGMPARSYLLENAGNGRFRDVTSERAPALANAGMVTSGAWVDYDHDGKLDLIVTGEWMPVMVLRQENARFVERTNEAGFARTNGWWNDVTVADVNGDGYPDLLLGNLGLNSYLTASPTQPARLYAGDFARNRSVIPLLTSYKNGVSYLVATLDELTAAIPGLRGRFSSYASFGARGIEGTVDPSALGAARVLEAYEFASSVAINTGSGGFVLRRLPDEAQLAPVRASFAADVDGDGQVDVLLAGNVFGVPPVFGRYDASYGLLLRGTGSGQFTAIDLPASGLAVDGQVRHIRTLRDAHGRRLVVMARNDDTLRVLRIERSSPRVLSLFP